MTLDEAVAILDREKHNGYRWAAETSWDGTGRYAECDGDAFEDRSEFEAIAIAREYERIDAERRIAVMNDLKVSVRNHFAGPADNQGL